MCEHRDAKADPAWTGGRLARNDPNGRRVRSASPGWWVTACQQGSASNTGSPLEVATVRPPDASGVRPQAGDGGVRSTVEAGESRGREGTLVLGRGRSSQWGIAG